jgi:hypothetical protein
VPLLVAALVWLTRILIIGTFSVAGDRLFSQVEGALQGAEQAAWRSQAARAPRFGETQSPARPAPVAARIIGQNQPANGPAMRPAASQPARPAARPAPKPANPARQPSATGGWADDWPHDERDLADDSLAFSRPAGGARPANGVNGPKTIE